MNKIFFRRRRRLAFANGFPLYKAERKKLTLRQKIYLFVSIFGVLVIVNPLVAFADIFGYEVADVYFNITRNVAETNDIIAKAFAFATTSPYDVINSIAGTAQGTLASNIHGAVITTALAVATLLIMVDFFKKTINFEWSSKWENILLFLVKIIVIKQVVQNADVIVGYIYALFNHINAIACDNMQTFLPYEEKKYTILSYNTGSAAQNFFNSVADFFTGNDVRDETVYIISPSSVEMFYGQGSVNFNSIDGAFQAPYIEGGAFGFNPTMEIAMWQPYFIIMKAIAYLIFVKVIGRVFELCVFTLFAPLPLATFASEESKEVGKSFIKTYIGIILEVAVIAVMFVSFFAVQNYMRNAGTSISVNASGVPLIGSLLRELKSTKFIDFVILISFGLAIIKSGSWSKKLCGAA